MPTAILTYAATINNIYTGEQATDLNVLRAFDGHKDTTDLRELLSDDHLIEPLQLTRISPRLKFLEDKQQIAMQLVIDSRTVIASEDLRMLTRLLEEVLEALWRSEFSYPNGLDEYGVRFEAMPEVAESNL